MSELHTSWNVPLFQEILGLHMNNVAWLYTHECNYHFYISWNALSNDGISRWKGYHHKNSNVRIIVYWMQPIHNLAAWLYFTKDSYFSNGSSKNYKILCHLHTSFYNLTKMNLFVRAEHLSNDLHYINIFFQQVLLNTGHRP